MGLILNNLVSKEDENIGNMRDAQQSMDDLLQKYQAAKSIYDGGAAGDAGRGEDAAPQTQTQVQTQAQAQATAPAEQHLDAASLGGGLVGRAMFPYQDSSSANRAPPSGGAASLEPDLQPDLLRYQKPQRDAFPQYEPLAGKASLMQKDPQAHFSDARFEAARDGSVLDGLRQGLGYARAAAASKLDELHKLVSGAPEKAQFNDRQYEAGQARSTLGKLDRKLEMLKVKAADAAGRLLPTFDAADEKPTAGNAANSAKLATIPLTEYAKPDPKWLQVGSGQLSFDAEGQEGINNPYYSRVLHWPQGDSGVTLGRGYDMRQRSEKDVAADLADAGLDEKTAALFAKGAQLKGREARQFVADNRETLGQIPAEVQQKLFAIAYKEKMDYVKGVYGRATKSVPDAARWDELKPAIRDVATDLAYQGTNWDEMRGLAGNDIDTAIDYIRGNKKLMGYEKNRQRIPYLENHR